MKQVVVEGAMCHGGNDGDRDQAYQTDDRYRHRSAAPYYIQSHTHAPFDYNRERESLFSGRYPPNTTRQPALTLTVTPTLSLSLIPLTLTDLR